MESSCKRFRCPKRADHSVGPNFASLPRDTLFGQILTSNSADSVIFYPERAKNSGEMFAIREARTSRQSIKKNWVKILDRTFDRSFEFCSEYITFHSINDRAEGYFGQGVIYFIGICLHHTGQLGHTPFTLYAWVTTCCYYIRLPKKSLGSRTAFEKLSEECASPFMLIHPSASFTFRRN